jgi:hypothetical protein
VFLRDLGLLPSFDGHTLDQKPKWEQQLSDAPQRIASPGRAASRQGRQLECNPKAGDAEADDADDAKGE